jgi:hypothetical protein
MRNSAGCVNSTANDFGITSTIDATVDAAGDFSPGGNCNLLTGDKLSRGLPVPREIANRLSSIGYICMSHLDAWVTRHSMGRA